MFLISKTLYTC